METGARSDTQSTEHSPASMHGVLFFLSDHASVRPLCHEVLPAFVELARIRFSQAFGQGSEPQRDTQAFHTTPAAVTLQAQQTPAARRLRLPTDFCSTIKPQRMRPRPTAEFKNSRPFTVSSTNCSSTPSRSPRRDVSTSWTFRWCKGVAGTGFEGGEGVNPFGHVSPILATKHLGLD